MSILSINNVSIHRTTKTSDPDFYVASIVDSDSGYLTPKLVSDKESLVNIFGSSFSYEYMYELIIGNKIPVLLIPIITKLSDYNRCSLRLSNGNITVSHPRYKEEYKYISLGNIYYTEFTSDQLDIFNSITIDNPLSFYPQVVVESSSEVVDNEIKYLTVDGKSKIQVTFSKVISGSLTIEGLPQIDSNSEYILINNIANNGTDHKFKLINSILPEVVVTDYNGMLVEARLELITDNLGTSYVNVVFDSIDNAQYRIDIRQIPDNLVITRSLLANDTAIGNLNHYSNFKLSLSDIESIGNVEYRNGNAAVISISNYNDTKLNYNIVSDGNDIDVSSIYTGAKTFNTILDLSNITDEKLSDGTADYIILDLNGTKTLISTIPDLPYSLTKSYYTESWIPSTKVKTRYEFIKELQSYLIGKLGDNKCTDVTDRIINFMTSVYDKYGIPSSVDDLWFEDIYSYVYDLDFWLCTNRYVEETLKTCFSTVTDYTKFKTQVSSYLESNRESIDNNKLLIEYSIPSQNLNYYSFDELIVNQSYNLSQDKLCELTELDKICEFYSKIKGPVGKGITIKISGNTLYKNVYDITISLNNNVESYTIYTYKHSDTPDECISLRELGRQSSLVSTRLFDYVLKSGKLIDQFEFDEYKDDTEEYDSNRLRSYTELYLPEGTYTLDRVLDESSDYSDVLSTTKLFVDSGWYPDLFLINDLNYGTDNAGYLQYLSKEFSEYIPTQCLVNLNENVFADQTDITSLLVSSNNRMLYFYGHPTIDDEPVCMTYPYIINLIKATYLKDISEYVYYSTDIEKGNYVEYNGVVSKITKLINGVATLANGSSADVTKLNKIDSLLDNNHVNHILYNGLYYYFVTYYESVKQPSEFIIRFIASKITRLFYSNKTNLISMSEMDISDTINNVTDNLVNLIPIISSIDTRYSRDNNTLNITVITTVKYIVNKVYKINIIINN